MPTTINPTPSTTSENGRNIRAELYADSYFFLEKDRAFTQTAGQKFGVVESGGNFVFRTTAKISFAGEAKIFAICQGQIFLQPNSSSSEKINLILKPFRQPINGLAIQYIVYRGLRKSDFMDENEEILPDLENSTGYIKHIRKEFKAFFDYIETDEPIFKAEYVGFPSNDSPQDEADLIEDYFSKVSEISEENGQATESHPFDFPIIPAGTYIGNALGELGIDIVLNEGDCTVNNDPNPFKLNLSYARASEYELNTANFSGIQKKLIQESATQFIDIAAFYGLHAYGNGKIRFGGDSEVLKNEDEIYNLIQYFHTKSTMYLYVQSNRQRSYNFYGNYKFSDSNPNNIKIGTNENNLTEKTYGTEEWTVEEFKNNINSDSLFISLINNKSYFDKIFYVDIGNPLKKNRDILFLKEFKNISEISEKDFLEPVNFQLKKVGGIIKMVYVGDNINEPYLNDDVYFLSKHHNVVRELHPVINVKSCLVSENNFVNISFNKKSFVNFNDFSNLQSISTINNNLIFYTGKKTGDNETLYKEKVLFLAKKEDTIDSLDTNNQNLIFGARSSMNMSVPKDSDTGFLMMKIFGDKNYQYYYNEVADNSQTVKLLKLKLNGEIDTTYFSIGILKEEYDTLLGIIPAGSSNVKLYINEEQQNPLLDIDAKKSYFKYSLGINFEDVNGNLQILFPTDKIYVYGESIYFFVSKEFAEYETTFIDDVNIIPPKTITE